MNSSWSARQKEQPVHDEHFLMSQASRSDTEQRRQHAGNHAGQATKSVIVPFFSNPSIGSDPCRTTRGLAISDQGRSGEPERPEMFRCFAAASHIPDMQVCGSACMQMRTLSDSTPLVRGRFVGVM